MTRASFLATALAAFASALPAAPLSAASPAEAPLAATTPSQWSQPGSARPRDILALQDDLGSLDDSLSDFPREHRRYAEFQQRADVLREDVTCLKVQMRRYTESRRPGIGASRAEVVALRRRVAALRDDIEAVEERQAARSPSLPADTELHVRLEQPLSSRSARREDRVEATVVEPVRINGRTVLPAGTVVSGVVVAADPAGRFHDSGQLRLAFNSLEWENGVRTPVRAEVVAVSESGSGGVRGKEVGLGALLGGVVGAIVDGRHGALVGAAIGASGALVASRGQNVELPEGALLTLRLVDPVQIARR